MSNTENFRENKINSFIINKNIIKKLLINITIISSFKKINILKLIVFIIFIILCLFYLTYYLPKELEPSNYEMKRYIKFNLGGRLIHSKKFFFKRDNPKISIVISTFNGEVYLKPVVRSIQNQNFLNIEIIIVDDGSKDNTVKVVKELMEEDPRIKLISNGINRGTLYTKTRGVLNAKGKYVMTLDHDNLYSTNYVFSRLYCESEKYNLDLLGFSVIGTPAEVKIKKENNVNNYFETPIIRKPNIKRRFLAFIKSEESCMYLCLYFIKTKLFLNVIKQLGEEFINRNIDAHDDTILMFILSRNALSLKHLKKIFYICLEWPKEYDEALKFQRNMKSIERERKNCYSYLTFLEITFLFTENNNDKNIAERCFHMWFLERDECKKQKDIMNYAIKICNLYLNNEYISSDTKAKISIYLNQTRNIKY